MKNNDDNPLGIKLAFHHFIKLKVLGKSSFWEILLVQIKAILDHENTYKKTSKIKHQ